MRLSSLALKPWYRAVATVAVIAGAIKIYENGRGPDFPSFIARIPDLPFFFAVIVLFSPVYLHMAEQTRERNLRFYDPNSPEIRKRARNFSRLGVALLMAPTLAIMGLAVFAEDSFVFRLPTLVIVAPIILSIAIGTFLLGHSQSLRTGMWSPPEWMPPMDSNIEETQIDEKS